MKYKLSTPYKGNRHYIQGGDLFNTAQSVAEKATGVKKAYVSKLSFTRFAYRQCELVINPIAIESDAKPMGEGVFRLPDGIDQAFFLFEGEEEPIERSPYDEDGMVAPAIFTDLSAILHGPLQYSSIEAVIALTKVLNYRLAAPKEGKWIFGKIELNQLLPSIEKILTIKRTKSVSGRFSINEINIDGVYVGNIHFIVGAP